MSSNETANGLLDDLIHAGTATIASQLFDRRVHNVVLSGLVHRGGATAFAGFAATLRFVPARGDRSIRSLLADPRYPQRELIDTARPQTVVVIDALGDARVGVVGGILAARLAASGAAAAIVDGGVRDTVELTESSLAVWSRHASPGLHLACLESVDSQVPIACCGVQVRPGDIVVGDHDGVVCVPPQLAEEIATAALEQAAYERQILRKVRNGSPLRGNYPPSKIDL